MPGGFKLGFAMHLVVLLTSTKSAWTSYAEEYLKIKLLVSTASLIFCCLHAARLRVQNAGESKEVRRHVTPGHFFSQI